jgi:hypothetical protein
MYMSPFLNYKGICYMGLFRLDSRGFMPWFPIPWIDHPRAYSMYLGTMRYIVIPYIDFITDSIHG